MELEDGNTEKAKEFFERGRNNGARGKLIFPVFRNKDTAEKVTKANENKSNKDVITKSVSKTEQSSKPKKSGLKPVESVKKEKKVVPTRAANDPRYKS